MRGKECSQLEKAKKCALQKSCQNAKQASRETQEVAEMLHNVLHMEQDETASARVCHEDDEMALAPQPITNNQAELQPPDISPITRGSNCEQHPQSNYAQAHGYAKSRATVVDYNALPNEDRDKNEECASEEAEKLPRSNRPLRGARKGYRSGAYLFRPRNGRRYHKYQKNLDVLAVCIKDGGKVCAFFARGNCTKGEECIYRHVDPEQCHFPNSNSKPSRQRKLTYIDYGSEILEPIEPNDATYSNDAPYSNGRSLPHTLLYSGSRREPNGHLLESPAINFNFPSSINSENSSVQANGYSNFDRLLRPRRQVQPLSQIRTEWRKKEQTSEQKVEASDDIDKASTPVGESFGMEMAQSLVPGEAIKNGITRSGEFAPGKHSRENEVPGMTAMNPNPALQSPICGEFLLHGSCNMDRCILLHEMVGAPEMASLPAVKEPPLNDSKDRQKLVETIRKQMFAQLGEHDSQAPGDRMRQPDSTIEKSDTTQQNDSKRSENGTTKKQVKRGEEPNDDFVYPKEVHVLAGIINGSNLDTLAEIFELCGGNIDQAIDLLLPGTMSQQHLSGFKNTKTEASTANSFTNVIDSQLAEEMEANPHFEPPTLNRTKDAFDYAPVYREWQHLIDGVPHNEWQVDGRSLEEKTLTPDLSSRLKLDLLFTKFPSVDKSTIRSVFVHSGYSITASERSLKDIFPSQFSPGVPVVRDDSSIKQDSKIKLDSQIIDVLTTITPQEDSGERDKFIESLRGDVSDHLNRKKAFYEASLEEKQNSCYGKSKELTAKAALENRRAHVSKLRAMRETFKRKNGHLDNMKVVDLHGLHVREGIHVMKIVMEYLKRTQPERRDNKLTVITGVGTHNVDSKSRLFPAMLRLFKEQRYKYTKKRGELVVYY